MITSICSKYASPPANLSSLRIAALFITAYCAFLSFDELAKLRCCDVNFHNLDYVKISIVSSKLMCIGMVPQFFWLGQVLSLVPIQYFLVIFISLL